MPVTTTPTTTPTGLPSRGPITTRTLGPSQPIQQMWTQNLLASLKKAGVSDATANQVAQDQAQKQNQLINWIGEVKHVSTYAMSTDFPGMTFVEVFKVAWLNPLSADQEWAFNFPPNDPKLLPELVRSQTAPRYPNGRSSVGVQLLIDNSDPNNPMLLNLMVFSRPIDENTDLPSS